MLKKQNILLICCLISFYACKKKETTLPPNTVMDADKNVYTYVTIGNQTWMAQNLKTTTYNNSVKIRDGQTDTAWVNSNLNNRPDSGAYCWYNTHDGTKDSLVTKYGRLYNFYAVNTGNLCPTGWHVPNNTDWQRLEDTLTKLGLNAAALKDQTWTNTTATNKTGFSALPDGFRGINGIFDKIEINTIFWSSTKGVDRFLESTDMLIGKETNINSLYGFSVRCVKN